MDNRSTSVASGISLSGLTFIVFLVEVATPTMKIIKKSTPKDYIATLTKEVYEGKTYLTVFESTGNNLIDCAGLRILLNEETNEDKD